MTANTLLQILFGVVFLLVIAGAYFVGKEAGSEGARQRLLDELSEQSAARSAKPSKEKAA